MCPFALQYSYEEESHFEDAPESGLGSAGLGDLLADDQAKQ